MGDINIQVESDGSVQNVTVSPDTQEVNIQVQATTGPQGASGYSGFSGQNGIIGVDGQSGYSGYSGNAGASGYSGYSGLSGFSGQNGSVGTSGYSGYSGAMGLSGFSGYSGLSGFSGFSGRSGFSGYSGLSVSGFSGYSGLGVSGYSGYSGAFGSIGAGTVVGNNTTSSATPSAVNAEVVIISETTISNQASFNIDLTNYYNVYRKITIEIFQLNPATTSTDLQLQFSQDAVSFDATSYGWTIDGVFSNNNTLNGSSSTTTSVSGQTNTVCVVGNSIGNGSAFNNTFTLTFNDLGNSSFNPSYHGLASYSVNAGAIGTRLIGGWRSNAQITKALKFNMSSGNLSCKYRVIALKQ